MDTQQWSGDAAGDNDSIGNDGGIGHDGGVGRGSGGDATQRSEYLRNRAIVSSIEGGAGVAETARRYGVSRQWASELRRRWRQEGDAGLLPRSRAARTVANRTDPAMAARIVALRGQLEEEGLDAGAESIAARLEREGLKPPANSTIHRILRDAGLVRPEPRKRPRSSYVRFEASLPNELWQSDFTHWPIVGLDTLIVSWIDDHSRYLLYIHAFATVTMGTVQDTFRRACAEHGIPASTLTDNGTVYTTRLVSPDPGLFERMLALMGVRQRNGRPGHPQTQGKIERYHRTLKKWLTARPLAADTDDLNGQLDEFRRVYNEERPHRALNRRTPGEAYRARGKALPDPELAARAQARADAGTRQDGDGPAEGTRRTRPDKAAGRNRRKRPARAADVTTEPRILRVDDRGCIGQGGIAGGRRTFNLGRHNAGRTVEFHVDHGQAIAVDTETGEILLDQPLDTSRRYQYRHPIDTVNHAPTHTSTMP